MFWDARKCLSDVAWSPGTSRMPGLGWEDGIEKGSGSSCLTWAENEGLFSLLFSIHSGGGAGSCLRPGSRRSWAECAELREAHVDETKPGRSEKSQKMRFVSPRHLGSRLGKLGRGALPGDAP